MVGIILASHGNFSTGILQSASMLFGEQPNVKAVSLLPGEKAEEIRMKMEEAVKSFDDPDNVVVFADLWGGSPFNQAKLLMQGHEDKWAMVTGMNLAMIITAIVSCMSSNSAQEVALSVLEPAKNGIRIYPEGLDKE